MAVDAWDVAGKAASAAKQVAVLLASVVLAMAVDAWDMAGKAASAA